MPIDLDWPDRRRFRSYIDRERRWFSSAKKERIEIFFSNCIVQRKNRDFSVFVRDCRISSFWLHAREKNETKMRRRMNGDDAFFGDVSSWEYDHVRISSFWFSKIWNCRPVFWKLKEEKWVRDCEWKDFYWICYFQIWSEVVEWVIWLSQLLWQLFECFSLLHPRNHSRKSLELRWELGEKQWSKLTLYQTWKTRSFSDNWRWWFR